MAKKPASPSAGTSTSIRGLMNWVQLQQQGNVQVPSMVTDWIHANAAPSQAGPTPGGLRPHPNIQAVAPKFDQATSHASLVNYMKYVKGVIGNQRTPYDSSSGTPPSVLDYLPSGIPEALKPKPSGYGATFDKMFGGPTLTDWSSPEGKKQMLAYMLQKSKAGKYTYTDQPKPILQPGAPTDKGLWSMAKEDIGAIADAGKGIWHALFGGGGPTKHTGTYNQATTQQIVGDYIAAGQKAGLPQDEVMNSLARHLGGKINLDVTNTKSVNKFLKGVFHDTVAYKTAAAITKQVQQQQSTANQVSQFIMNQLQPQDQAEISRMMDLYNKYVPYWSRKEAGLTGKKLGTNPLTGTGMENRKLLGLDPTEKVTPQAIREYITSQYNNPMQLMFTNVQQKIKDAGLENQVQEVLQYGMMKNDKLTKKPTMSMQGMFTVGKIDMEDVVRAYYEVYTNPDLVTQLSTTKSAANTGTPFQQESKKK